MLELGIDVSRLRQASDRIRKVMQIVPEGENKPLYVLARDSARKFLDRKRHGGNQDVILLDSVLSIAQRYKMVVKWVGSYEQYLAVKALTHSLETLATLDLDGYGQHLRNLGFQSVPTQSRIECAKELGRLFLQKYPESIDGKSCGIFRWVEDTEGWTQFLRPYSERDEICNAFTDAMLRELNISFRQTTLCGLSLFQYLRMQCGEDTLKPDRRVIGNLKRLLQVDELTGTRCLILASAISKELEIRLIELDQLLVCEDYLSGEQKFQTLLGTVEQTDRREYPRQS